MAPMKELPCWDIMNCTTKGCPARRFALEKECWEIVQELEDYRAEFDICRDCLVYVLKNGKAILSEEEMTAISERRVPCVLSA